MRKAGIIFVLFLPIALWGNSGDLEKTSMLYQSKKLAEEASQKKHEWFTSTAPNPKKALEKASVWLKISPPLLITPVNQSTASYLARFDLWEELQNLSIQAIDLGPTQLSGELLQGETLTQTDVFAPISFQINPLLGTWGEMQKMVETANAFQAIWISNLDIENTGRGADFWLALQNFQEYPSLYLMKPLEEKDWKLLPAAFNGNLSATLSLKEVDLLKNKGYLGKEIELWNFSQPYQKATNIDATIPILGRDGKKRRWIYMHASEPTLPLLNPLHPSFASERLLAGALDTLLSHGSQMVKMLTRTKWTQSKTSFLPMQEQLAYLTRSKHAFYVQDQDLPLESLQALSTYAADLSYDYFLTKGITRALFSQKTELLRTNYRALSTYGLTPLLFVHTLALKKEQGENSTNPNEKRTIVELIAEALHISDLSQATDLEKEKIKKVHLLLITLQAMQPGALLLTGEDLVGAYSLPCPKETCLRDVFAYDLLGDNPNLCVSRFAIPKGNALYGSLVKQKKDPFSFTSKVKNILKARKNYQIFSSDLVSIPEPRSPSLLLLLHRLPTTQNLELTAINFGQNPVSEEIEIEGIQNTSPINLLTRKKEVKDFASKKIAITLDPYEGKAILFQPKFFENNPAIR